jgi:hypothetical protein
MQQNPTQASFKRQHMQSIILVITEVFLNLIWWQWWRFNCGICDYWTLPIIFFVYFLARELGHVIDQTDSHQLLHCGGLDLLSGQSMQDLKWTEWHWDRFF